jgi:hypothetical protein
MASTCVINIGAPQNQYQHMKLNTQIVTLALPILLASCAAYGPYHPNTSAQPLNSVRGPADGRYKLAFVEFGDQGSALDTSQRAAALGVIHEAKRPLLFVYIHGWHNDANSADVCRFEHFIDTVSRFPEVTGRKLDVIGVYIAWRGRDITVPGLDLFTFWSRKHAGGEVAAQNACLATINELALAARAPGKNFTIACCSAILLAAWCSRTLFLIRSLMPAATVHAIAAPGTWLWRLIRLIAPSAAGN